MKYEKSCGAIIIKDNRVLLIKQNIGFYGFPKGHVEDGETEEETAIREVKEETNLDITINKKYRYEIEYMVNEDTSKNENDVNFQNVFDLNVNEQNYQEDKII